VVSPHKDVVDSIALVSSVHVSALSTLFAKELLGSPELPGLIKLNKEKLASAYIETTDFLKRVGIAYFPCNAAVFLFCKLAPDATTIEEEMTAFRQYVEAGVMVAPGRAYHVNTSQKGWMRISFAVDYEELQKGLMRIESVYRSLRQGV
jgi:aspartate/methionine/tyrosine aminotransferase